MSTPRPNGFIRSKLKEAPKFADLLLKLAALYPKKKNCFSIENKGKLLVGEAMSAVSFADPTKITFTYDGIDYQLLLADVKIVQRIRCRKYKFKTDNVTTVI